MGLDAVKNSDGSPEWISGLGATEEEALEDTLKWFMDSVGNAPLPADDFTWSDPHEF